MRPDLLRDTAEPIVRVSHLPRARSRHLEEEQRLEGRLPLPFHPALGAERVERSSA